MLENWVNLSLCYESRLLSFLCVCVVLEDSQKLTPLPGITGEATETYSLTLGKSPNNDT